MPLAWEIDELGGCHAAEAAVRTQIVVVDPPCLDDPVRCSERGEQMLVQALVAQATIKALDEAVLLGACLARCNATRPRCPGTRRGPHDWSARCRCR